jgi:superfamily II DNA helicase RecQ
MSFLEKSVCRSKQLLEYFGQNSKSCGKCDVCLSELQESHKIEQYREEIILFLENPQSIQQIEDKFGIKNQVVKQIIRALLHEGIIEYQNELFCKNGISD